MKQRTWTGVLAVAVVAVLTWLYCNRETVEWSSVIPYRFRGTWRLIENYYSDTNGIRSIHLSANAIALDMVLDRNEKERRQFPIRRVSITARDGLKAGEMVIFYGAANNGTIAENRLQFYFGPKQKVTVYRILPTGFGEDHWFDVGEFVKVN